MPAPWSWRRALLIAGLAFGVTVAVGAAAAGVMGVSGAGASRKFGEGVVRLSVFVGAVAFAVSWARQTGRKRLAIGLVAGFVVAFGAAFAAVVLVKPAKRAEPLTAAEKAPLAVVDEGGQRRLRHPALGFSLLHPGPGFHESAEVVAAVTGGRPDPETQSYGFIGPDQRSTLVISVMKNMGGSREALSEHIDGFQRGIAGAVPAGAPVRWEGKEITWDDRRRVARVSARVGDVAHIDAAAYAIEPPGQPPFIVNVMTTSPEANQFPGLLDSFRP